MRLLPETKLLIAEYGDAAFAYGVVEDGIDGDVSAAFADLTTANDNLVRHLETHYTPTPQA